MTQSPTGRPTAHAFALTQAEVAEALGMTRKLVQKLEDRGLAKLRAECAARNISVDDVLPLIAPRVEWPEDYVEPLG